MFHTLFSLDAASPLPLYEQIYRSFVSAIQSGELKCGEKLPSKRALCAQLGVSQSTVETAYGILISEGYIVSRPKSGYYAAEYDAAPAWRSAETREKAPEYAHISPPEIDFSTAAVDTRLFPYSSWAKLNKEVVYSSPELLQRGDGQGEPALRYALSAFLSQYRGVVCTPGQIVIGAGIEVLMGLLLPLFGPDAEFALEDPGYSAIDELLRGSGRKIHHIPVDSGGMSPEGLTGSAASIAYITPSHQFPLGASMSAGRRSRFLRWASEAEGRYIIEDDYDSEFRYASRPIPAMQGMDSSGRVIYIGTFSRSLAPSIRMAYMVLPDALMERYKSVFSHRQSTVSRYEQAVMARFLEEGFYSRYIRRVGSLYKRRRARLIDSFSSADALSISGDSGGMHFLITHRTLSEQELISRAAEKGITLRGLSAYCRELPPIPSTLVLGYGGLRDDKIEEAVSILLDAWK